MSDDREGPDLPETQAMGSDPGTRYERLDRIATGGMGEVWRARDTVLGREVAVKVLKQEYADDATFRARFADEARHAAGLHHPGIAAIFDYGALEGQTPYLVMELVDGRPLSELISEDRPIDPEQARLLALQVAEALAVAHRAGVVHRDVKPANLLVTPDGLIKITDFGIARAVDSVPYTQTGQIVGTPHYISPEQARGETATAASDVYALGVVLFECLNGSRPFVADSPIATALAHIREEVPPLPDQVPAALGAVVRRALAKAPKDRYPDGAALAAALRDAAEGTTATPVPAAAPAPAETTEVLPPVAPVAAAAAPEPAPEPVPKAEPAPARSSRWPLYTAGALVLLVAIVLLVARPWSDGSDGSSDAEMVRVRAKAYLGEPVADVEAALGDLGLKTRTNEVTNRGGKKAGTVADLDPTGRVKQGTTITLDVWGEPEKGDQGDSGNQGDQGGAGGDQSTQEPDPEPEPTEESTPTEEPTQEPTDEPTQEPTQEPNGQQNGQDKQNKGPARPDPSTGPKGD